MKIVFHFPLQHIEQIATVGSSLPSSIVAQSKTMYCRFPPKRLAICTLLLVELSTSVKIRSLRQTPSLHLADDLWAFLRTIPDPLS